MGLDKIRVNRLLVLPGTPLYRKIIQKFPEIADKDIVPMDDLQKMIFQTDLYDLSEFDNDVDKFIEALLETAHIMANVITEHGGASEGYGHGKGENILEGKELE